MNSRKYNNKLFRPKYNILPYYFNLHQLDIINVLNKFNLQFIRLNNEHKINYASVL